MCFTSLPWLCFNWELFCCIKYAHLYLDKRLTPQPVRVLQDDPVWIFHHVSWCNLEKLTDWFSCTVLICVEVRMFRATSHTQQPSYTQPTLPSCFVTFFWTLPFHSFTSYCFSSSFWLDNPNLSSQYFLFECSIPSCLPNVTEQDLSMKEVKQK